MSKPSRLDRYLPEITNIYDGTTTSVKTIIAKYGISESWAYMYLNQKGIRAKGKDRKVWSEERDEKLIELLGTNDRKTTARKLGFTEKSVRSRIRRLRLTEQKCRYDWYNLSEVCLLLGLSPDYLLNRIKDGRLKANGYNGIEGSSKSCWLIRRADIANYVIENTSELEGKKVDLGFIIRLVTDHKQKASVDKSKVLS